MPTDDDGDEARAALGHKILDVARLHIRQFVW